LKKSQEDASRALRVAGYPSARCASQQPALGEPAARIDAAARLRRLREPYAKHRAAPQFAVDADRATQHVDEAPGQVEAQADAAVMARHMRLHLSKRLEDQPVMLMRDADSGVGDDELHSARRFLDGEADLASRRELEGVFEQGFARQPP